MLLGNRRSYLDTFYTSYHQSKPSFRFFYSGPRAPSFYLVFLVSPRSSQWPIPGSSLLSQHYREILTTWSVPFVTVGNKCQCTRPYMDQPTNRNKSHKNILMLWNCGTVGLWDSLQITLHNLSSVNQFYFESNSTKCLTTQRNGNINSNFLNLSKIMF